MEKIAFISGANRGIGYETAKKLGETGINVILGCRDLAKGKSAAESLIANGIKAEALKYDAMDPHAPEEIFNYINDKYKKLDILINNAGILLEPLFGKNSSTVTGQVIKDTYQTNLFAVIALTQKLLPLIKASDAGRIVNVSTILSSLTLQSKADSPIAPAKAFAYNSSKTALNAYTIHLANELKNTNIKVNAGHPGWVKTELGGPKAPIEVEDSYKTSVYLATLDHEGPTGGLFQENNALPW